MEGCGSLVLGSVAKAFGGVANLAKAWLTSPTLGIRVIL